jgi:hypothetical protein
MLPGTSEVGLSQRSWLTVEVQGAAQAVGQRWRGMLAWIAHHPEIHRRVTVKDEERRTAFLVKETMVWVQRSDYARPMDPVTSEAMRLFSSGDLSRAAEVRALLEAQSKRGDIAAIALFGFVIETGFGGAPGPREAIGLYRRAAREGHPLAQVRLAVIELRAGQGGMEPAAAVNLLGRAALRGYAPAMYRLGRFHTDGIGVEMDIAAAQSWFFKAARLGHVRAQLALAEVLASHGTPGALEDAMVWLQRASAVDEALSLEEEARASSLSQMVEGKLPVWALERAKVRAQSKEWLEDPDAPELKWRNF